MESWKCYITMHCSYFLMMDFGVYRNFSSLPRWNLVCLQTTNKRWYFLWLMMTGLQIRLPSLSSGLLPIYIYALLQYIRKHITYLARIKQRFGLYGLWKSIFSRKGMYAASLILSQGPTLMYREQQGRRNGELTSIPTAVKSKDLNH